MSSLFRLAHLSDLHFSHPSYSFTHFFSKRWLGKLNFLLSRKEDFLTQSLPSLADALQDLKTSHVVITGDVTTTSQEEEFAAAASFVKLLEAKGMHVFVIPGNHDQYTKKAYRDQIFYNHFPFHSLKEHKAAAIKLAPKWWILFLDTAVATHLVSSRGHFAESTEHHLRALLSSIPQADHILLANHFPFFEQENPRKALERREALKELLLSFPNIKLYLHGHTHRHSLADLRAAGLPIVLDSGSTSHRENGHFHQIEMYEERCDISVYRWKDGLSVRSNQASFSWRDAL